MRITLVISSLRGGGAERVMSIMASHWAACGWSVTLLTYDDGREAPAYDLHAGVVLRQLGIERQSSGLVEAVGNNLKHLRVLRRAIGESAPDAVVSFMDVVNVRTILATLGLGIPVIVSEHNDPAYHLIRAGWSALRRWSYRYATCVVALTPDALQYFPDSIRRRGHVIPNPVALPSDADPARAGRKKTVMAMGRLHPQKGFDRLIAAFSMVAENHPGWSLTIWGEGDDRQELEVLRDRLDLQGRVAFPGWTSDPFTEMQTAGLFVLSSRYEGFGNVLCEAMACGLPVVSFDCPSGPRHIVRDGIDGILVPPGDVKQLAAAMDRLMADQTERERLAANGIEVIERFGKDKVMGMWERLIASCTSPH